MAPAAGPLASPCAGVPSSLGLDQLAISRACAMFDSLTLEGEPADMGTGFDQAAFLEPLQRLPQRGAADAELIHEVALRRELCAAADRLPSRIEAASLPAAVSGKDL